MPVKRAIFIIGGSKAVTLPASWLELAEKESGQPIKEVTIEIDDNLTIRPLIQKAH